MDRSPALDAGVRTELLARLTRLVVDRSPGSPRRHKPLVLLYALAQIHRVGTTDLAYEQVKAEVVPLLELFGHANRGRHQIYDPFGRLMKTEKLLVLDAPNWPNWAVGDPSDSVLRGAVGRLAPEYLSAVAQDRRFVRDATRVLLAKYFRDGEYEELLGMLGLPIEWASAAGDIDDEADGPERDPAFRSRVLVAYSYRCAATGFQGMLGSRAFALEAAHIRGKREGGACDITNGIALNPLIHKLFDMMAWTLTDDRRILVSDRFSESGWDVLRPLRDKPLADPKNPHDVPSIENLRYHRACWEAAQRDS